MVIMKKYITIFLCAISTFGYLPVHSLAIAVPAEEEQPAPTPQGLDLNAIKDELSLGVPDSNQMILNYIFVALEKMPETEVLDELAKGLTIDELRKVYKILAETTDYDRAPGFSEKVWQALSLKIKMESPVRYDNPRINLIAVTPGEKKFTMVLSDGSVWEVAERLSGDPGLDLIIIRNLLGQYTKVEELSTDNYSHRISALGFPDIGFAGYMMANKTSALVVDNKDLYWFGQLYL